VHLLTVRVRARHRVMVGVRVGVSQGGARALMKPNTLPRPHTKPNHDAHPTAAAAVPLLLSRGHLLRVRVRVRVRVGVRVRVRVRARARARARAKARARARVRATPTPNALLRRLLRHTCNAARSRGCVATASGSVIRMTAPG
jgi:hypothetical protein